MKPRQVLVRAVLLAVVLGVGLWARTLPSAGATSDRYGAFWPWKSTTSVTLYFSNGRYLFPVSRRMPANDELPRAALDALLAGPGAKSRLTSPIPPGVAIRSFRLAGGIARIDLSSALGEAPDAHAAALAITETMTRLPGVTSVALSVDGHPVAGSSSRTPLLYYASANGFVAVPAAVTDARAALRAYLSGPPAPELTGIPSDVRLQAYDYDPADRLISIGFTYTPAVRTLALEKPERMRMLLLGLIASLTEFPDVRAARPDFGGQSRLGLGECSDLLRTPQPRPALLNDERLLDD